MDWDDKSVGNRKKFDQKYLANQEYNNLRKFHLNGVFKSGQSICESCTDWKGMRWDWGYEKALEALRGDQTIPETPSPLD